MSLAEVLPTAQQLSSLDKLRLARILIQEVESEEEIFPLEANKSYYIATPYEMYGAAEILMQALEADDALGTDVP